jgi:hypothetical protein
VAEHNISLGYYIVLHATSILAKKSRSVDTIVREATETEVQPNNMNREDGLALSRSSESRIHTEVMEKVSL